MVVAQVLLLIASTGGICHLHQLAVMFLFVSNVSVLTVWGLYGDFIHCLSPFGSH